MSLKTTIVQKISSARWVWRTSVIFESHWSFLYQVSLLKHGLQWMVILRLCCGRREKKLTPLVTYAHLYFLEPMLRRTSWRGISAPTQRWVWKALSRSFGTGGGAWWPFYMNPRLHSSNLVPWHPLICWFFWQKGLSLLLWGLEKVFLLLSIWQTQSTTFWNFFRVPTVKTSNCSPFFPKSIFFGPSFFGPFLWCLKAWCKCSQYCRCFIASCSLRAAFLRDGSVIRVPSSTEHPTCPSVLFSHPP